MGNHQGKHKAKQEETIDYGTYTPFGIYQLSNLDYDQKIIKKLILERKIAPFYKGLNEPDEVVKLPSPLLSKLYQQPRPKSSSQLSLPSSGGGNNKWGNLTGHQKSQSQKSPKIDTSLANAQENILTGLYKKSIECPICFLYYPSNINYSSCCDEPICTECLVEIKRTANSETPPLCPFCAHENFAVRYDHLENPFLANPSNPEISDNDEKPQKHKSASSITADEFRPENMRNSSNRSSQRGAILGHPGRFLSIRPRSSRRNRGDLPSDYAGYLAAVHNMGVDIEELMIMEAIRASLLEAEQNGYSTENTPASQPAEAVNAPNDEETPSPQESPQETLPSPSEAADDTIQSDTTSIQTEPINSPTTSPTTTDLDDKRPITNSELIAQEDSTRIA